MIATYPTLSGQVKQAFGLYPSGNRCGHKPKEPRFVSMVNPHTADWNEDQRDDFGHKRKSHFFYQMDAALEEFYHFPKMLPQLGIIYRLSHQARRRSEAREADVAVLECVTHHMELSSRRFGYPSREGFIYYDNAFICRKTGLSESRVKRSLRRLRDAGYIDRQRRWVERDHGKFKALACMTVVNEILFQQLGLIDQLRAAAKRAYEKLKQAAKDGKIAVSSMLKCSFELLNEKQGRAAKKAKIEASAGYKKDDYPPTDSRHYLAQLPKAKHQAFNLQVAGLYVDDPEQDRATVYQRALQAIKNT